VSSPFSRPQIIRTKTQKKLKDEFVKVVVEPRTILSRREVCLNPIRQSRGFIVQEYTTILDRRRLGHLDRRKSINGILVNDRDICPEVPR